MNDHLTPEDIIREVLTNVYGRPHLTALAALDALVAERGAWKVEAVHHSGTASGLRDRIAELEAALRDIQALDIAESVQAAKAIARAALEKDVHKHDPKPNTGRGTIECAVCGETLEDPFADV